MRRKILKLLGNKLRLVRLLLVVKSSIAGILLLSISGLYATEPTVSIYPVSDSLFVAGDSPYATTNYAVYLGTASVTVVGAGWSPETAELLAQEIKKLTNKPIGDVIVPDHDPEYAGGCAYWKRIGANIVSTKLTEQTLEREWTKAGDFTRKYFSTYPTLPLVLPTKTYGADFTLENGDIRGLYLRPSHNVDDIFVYFPKQKVLYAGSIFISRLIRSFPATGQRCMDPD